MTVLLHRRAWLTVGGCLILLVVYLSLAPPADVPELGYGDKLGHLAAYFTLMFWFAQIWLRRLPPALSFLALGAVLEILQGLTSYRDMSPTDMLANASGVGLGWLAARSCPNLLARIEARLA